MREYGQIQCSFWTDPDVLALSNETKLLAVYLMTGPHSNGIGCYRLPSGYVEADFGWSAERVSKGFRELSEIGFAIYCERSQFVLMPKFLRFNPISNGNVATNREREFRAVPKNTSFYALLAASLLEFGNHFKDEFETLLQTLSKGLGEGFTKQDPTRPDPKRTEPKIKGADAPHADLQNLYHEILPELPPIRRWTDKRKSAFRNRWRDAQFNSLDFWRKYFEHVRAVPFLMGKNKRGWQADIDFLLREEKIVKVMEGSYEGEANV